MTSTSEIAEGAGREFCFGVPAFAGEPAVNCGAVLAEGSRVCPSCDAIIVSRQRAMADEASVAEVRSRLVAAGLSEPFVDGRKSLATVRFLTPEHEAAVAALMRLVGWQVADGNGLGVLLRGDPGIGKSDMLEGFVAALARAGRSGRYVNARDLALKFQASFRDDSAQSTSQIIDSLAAVRFLALDDLGATKTTRFVADALYTLLERRARNEMPTAVATNYLTFGELADRLKPLDGDELDAVRPVDRIAELCPTVIVLRGKSQRGVPA